MSTPNERSVIVASDIGYTTPTGKNLFSRLYFCINRGDKIFLIGKNGVGKSTLMKIISGVIQPSTGTQNSSDLSYSDQLDEGVGSNGAQTVLELIKSTDEDLWQIQLHFEKMFGGSLPNFNQQLKMLSGGEYMKLKLALATYNQPDTLLLDEPTNHLDLSSKEILQKFLTNFSGGVIVISHDIDFINQVATEIWELHDQKITKYGGNYQDYLRSKSQKDESTQRKLSEALKEVERSKWALIREEKRAAKSLRHGRINSGDRSMSKSERGFFKDKATVSANRNKQTLLSKIATAKEAVLSNTSTKSKESKIDLYEGENKMGRILFSISNGSLTVGSRQLIKNINLEIKFGDRVSLSGANGSGKTTLIKTILGHTIPGVSLLGDKVFRVDRLQGMYISQRYDQIDRNKSLAGNMRSANEKLDLQVIRRALGNLNFTEQHDVDRFASTLSGGETARLAFAMASISPSDLIVLDEPTNNLDIETINSVTKALSGFSGAILVVSHDQNFLKQISLDRTLSIEEGSLSESEVPLLISQSI